MQNEDRGVRLFMSSFCILHSDFCIPKGVTAPLRPVFALLPAGEGAAVTQDDEVEPPAFRDGVGPVAVVAAVQDGPAGHVFDGERLARQRLRLLAQAAADALE